MSKGHPALAASGTAWMLETRQEELDSKSYGLSPASANESFWSGNVSAAQLPSDLSTDMHAWSLQRHRRVRHCFQHPPQKQGVQMLQAHSQTLLTQVVQVLKMDKSSLQVFAPETHQRCRAADQLEGIHRMPEEPPGPACVWLFWGRGIPDTSTRASSLHQQQKGGWGPAPKQQETYLETSMTCFKKVLQLQAVLNCPMADQGLFYQVWFK